MSNHMKFCSCRACKAGKHCKRSKRATRRTVRGHRRKVKNLLKTEQFDKVLDEKVVSLPYTD